MDFSRYDRPEVLDILFYPRRESSGESSNSGCEILEIPVEPDMILGGRYYHAGETSPLILFFHGNGEIAVDYEDVASLYLKLGFSFLPVDYRGYGRSGGRPTVTAMMQDCHKIFDYVQKLRRERLHRGPLVVMGRSLGSASALELASNYPQDIQALIIESGFADIMPLLELLGISRGFLGYGEIDVFNHRDKIAAYKGPTLVIHAERDHIISFSQGITLYESSRSENKNFLGIKGANHNNIFQYGMREYFSAIKVMIDKGL